MRGFWVRAGRRSVLSCVRASLGMGGEAPFRWVCVGSKIGWDECGVDGGLWVPRTRPACWPGFRCGVIGMVRALRG